MKNGKSTSSVFSQNYKTSKYNCSTLTTPRSTKYIPFSPRYVSRMLSNIAPRKSDLCLDSFLKFKTCSIGFQYTYSRHTLSDTFFCAEKLCHQRKMCHLGYINEISWHTLSDTCLPKLCHFGKI